MRQRIIFILFTVLTCAVNLKAQRIVATSETPNFHVALPDSTKADGRAVIMCPGGGYNHIAKGHEGDDWIPFFTERGIAVIVLTYRLPEGDKELPLSDLRNTFKAVKEHSKEWHINPNGIGVMGFSAGGHLASIYATSEIGALKPAFQILFYPVIMLTPKAHAGMSEKFLGPKPSDKLQSEYSSNNRVDEDTPQAFIALANDDHTIDPINSINYYTALHKNNIPAAMFIYKSGGHGFGFRTSFPYHDEMLSDLSAWLKNIKVTNGNAQRVACIGNSITFGAGLTDRNTESYPAQMQQILGNDYEVKNFGLSGRTMTTSGFGYMKEKAWKRVKTYNPDIVFVKLGTNDSQPRYWKGVKEFETDAQSMIDTLKMIKSNPRIIVLLPIKSNKNHYNINDSLVTAAIIPCWKKLIKRNKLEMIDLHSITDNKPEILRDGVHPTKEGDTIIATAITEYLKKKK